MDEIVRLRLQLEDAAVNRALARARFLSASPDVLSFEEWLRIVREYHALIDQWALAEDAYIAHLRTH